MRDKSDERYYLDRAIAKIPELSGARIEEAESPDFLLRTDQRVVGIELTAFVESNGTTSTALAQSSLRQRVVELARKRYDERGGPPLHIDVMFGEHPALTKARVPKLAIEMADFLLGTTPKMLVYEENPLLGDFGSQHFPEVATIHAVRVPDRSYAGWVTGTAGWSWHVEQADIEHVIGRKEGFVATYRQKCDELWLLVVFDLYSAGNAIHPPTSPVSFTVSTGFDRVLCLDRLPGHVVDIPVRPKPAS